MSNCLRFIEHKSYNFLKGSETNYLSMDREKRKFPFYIGGTDACQGNI